MDLVGPFLIIIDYAMRYPEVVPLCKATTKNIAFRRDALKATLLIQSVISLRLHSY